MAKAYVEFVLRNRIAVLSITLLFTIVAGYSLKNGVIASSMVKLFLGESQSYAEYKKLREVLGDAELTIISVDASDLYTPQGWSRLEKAAQQLEEIELVEKVSRVPAAFRIRGDDDSLEVKSYDDLVAEGVSFKEIAEAVAADTSLAGTLLSKDGCCTALALELRPDDNRAVESLPPLIAKILAVLKQNGFEREDTHMAGLLAETVEATSQARYNIINIFPLTVTALVVAVFFLFGQFWPVYITTTVALISTTWTMGFSIAIDREVNILLAMVPAVMVIVAFSDIIHLCSSYLYELQEGKSKMEAIISSGSEVGEACFFTSITTFVGFIAMSMVPAPVFRHAGIVLGVGVAIALLLAMTLVPVFFYYMPTPTAKMRKEGVGAKFIDTITNTCLRWATQKPLYVIAVFVVLTIVSIASALTIEIETNMATRLARGNTVRESYEFLNDHYSGTANVDLFLERESGELLEPEFFTKIGELQEAIKSQEDVNFAESVYDLVQRVDEEMVGEEAHKNQKFTKALLAQYLLLFEMSGGEGTDALIDEEHSLMRIIIRANRVGMVRLAKIGLHAEKLAKDILGPDVRVSAGGMTYVFGLWLEELVAGQKRGLLFALFATTFMMIWALRLFSAGLLSMIPNTLPLVVLGGYLGVAYDVVDSDTLLIAMIAVGIAVDDTIHFLTRLRIEAARSTTMEAALERTMSFSGRAIVKTSIILCLGFWPFLLSDYYSTRIFGSLLPLTFVVALLADLLLLPALVRVGVIKLPLASDLT